MKAMKEMSKGHTKIMRLMVAGDVGEAGGPISISSILVTQKAVSYRLSHKVTVLPGATATRTKIDSTAHRLVNPTWQARIPSSFLRFHAIRVGLAIPMRELEQAWFHRFED